MHKQILLPRPSDQLWIVTDGSIPKHGIGATLYVTRHKKPSVSGFFSAKLRKHQVNWLPCKIEALSIGAAIKYFSPLIIQSKPKTFANHVYKHWRNCAGVNSHPVHVSHHFYPLPADIKYNCSICLEKLIYHLDFASRNAPDCNEPQCQICSFIIQTEDSVVRSASVQDILDGTTKLPFTSRSVWIKTLSECPDLQHVHAHSKQGTRPSKKLTNIQDINSVMCLII